MASLTHSIAFTKPHIVCSGAFGLPKQRLEGSSAVGVAARPGHVSSQELSSRVLSALPSGIPRLFSSSLGKREMKRLNSGAHLKVSAQAGSKGTFKGKVVPEPDFRIPIVLLGTAGLLLAADQKLAAAPVGLLGALLVFQTTRVRFLFDEDSLEVVIGEKAEKSGENVFVGGENRWKYSTFTNWEFWWPGFPVLVYFKETQTKPEGQVHFFPIIANGKELYDVMVERCGSSQNSGPSS